MVLTEGSFLITQEDLVLNYCRNFRNDSLVIKQNNDYNSINLISLNDNDIINVAKNAVLKHANFRTMKDAVEKSKNFNSENIELIHIIDIFDSNEYLNLLKAAISSQQPVLIASTNLDGSSHIRVVLAYDENNLVLYDPAKDKIVTVPTSEIKFNYDILVLKRK